MRLGSRCLYIVAGEPHPARCPSHRPAGRGALPCRPAAAAAAAAQPNLRPEKYAQRNRLLEDILRRHLPGGGDTDTAGAAVSLDHDGPGDDDDGEAVRADRTALRERILEAAYDPARLQACPEVEALAVRVAAVWSPSGLDLAGSDSDRRAHV